MTLSDYIADNFTQYQEEQAAAFIKAVEDLSESLGLDETDFIADLLNATDAYTRLHLK